MRCAVSLLVVLSVFGGTLACSKKTPEPTKSETAPVSHKLPAAEAAKAAVSGDGKLDPNDPKHGTRKLMGLDTPVYVDGVQVAVFRYGELPPIPYKVTEETESRRWTIYDYLKGIGVDVDALKSVHFHGNNDRIGSVEGSELRKEKDRFVFSFNNADTGAPIGRWSGTGLKNEFIAHEIRRMTVYVKKPSPAIHPQKQCHVGADGDCTEAIPYAEGGSTIAKGTRVYVDGKMVGFVKRRLVTDAMMVGPAAADPSDNKYSVAKLLAGLNVDVTSIKSIEVMAGDDVIARATGERFLASQTNFTLPSHNHGKVRIHVPAEFQAAQPGVADKDALTSAVLIYKNTTPAIANALVTISEDTDLSVQLAAIDDARGKLGRAE